MKQLKFFIFILVQEIILISSVGGESVSVFQRSPDVAVVTAKILEKCYGESVKEIGLAGNLSDSFIASVSSSGLAATVLLNSNERPVESGPVSKWSRYKLGTFAITATSSLELKKILDDIKNSRWWNHMAQFYIFGSSSQEKGCSEAFELLWTAWKMDILGAKIICNQDADGTVIYTFNPYTNYAPSPWKLQQTYRGVNDHPWALLVRKYHKSMNICKNLDFDKTKELAGYEIRLTMSRNLVLLNYTQTGQISPFKQTNTLLRMLLRYMNVTFKMTLHKNTPLGYIDKDGQGHGKLKDLTDGRSDMVWVVVPLAAVPELPGSYPILYQQMFAVTQYTSYLTQWQKVMSAVDFPSRIGVCIVILVNAITLKYLLGQSFIASVLDTIRMICNSCFTKLPNNFGPRIYLASLFTFVVVIQALYQGQLSALLAKQVRFPNVNNKDDLIKSTYAIYGWHNDSTVFTDPALKERFVGIDFLSQKCTEYVLLNSSIACVSARDWLIKDATESKLHMSTYPVLEVPVTAVIRNDWPLEAKLNRHNFRYLESGLFFYNYAKNFADDHRTLYLNENGSSNDDFKILTVADLDFAFVILGFGLGCAIISFIVELCIGMKRSAAVRTRLRVQRSF